MSFSAPVSLFGTPAFRPPVFGRPFGLPPVLWRPIGLPPASIDRFQINLTVSFLECNIPAFAAQHETVTHDAHDALFYMFGNVCARAIGEQYKKRHCASCASCRWRGIKASLPVLFGL